jgi:2-polyprenyl-3-methyl-5-hydroxy-6-metoxy-1,4-benzoquinol methylase
MGKEEQEKYGGNFERAIFTKNEHIYPREDARYKWARNNIVGSNILEIGCSNGYGTRYFNDIKNLNYLGLDYDKDVIEYAKKEYGDVNINFISSDIHDFKFGFYDTIIMMEVVEHLNDGKEILEKLKKHCKCLLVTSPYNEHIIGLREVEYDN